MHKNKFKVYIHFVWTTWDRKPMIIPALERRLHRNIESVAQKLGCTVIAINGMSDHIHILICLSANVTIAMLLQQMKGVSSHFFNDIFRPDHPFRWQPNYGAFSVSPEDVDSVAQYIRYQKSHHQAGTVTTEWEEPTENDPIKCVHEGGRSALAVPQVGTSVPATKT